MDDSETLPAVVVPAGEVEVSLPSGVIPSGYVETARHLQTEETVEIDTIAPQLPPVTAEEAQPPAPPRVPIERRVQCLTDKEAVALKKALGVVKKAQAAWVTPMPAFKSFRIVAKDGSGFVEAWGDPDVWISAQIGVNDSNGLANDLLPTERVYDYLGKRKGAVTLEVRCYADGAEELVIDGRLTLELVPPAPPKPKPDPKAIAEKTDTVPVKRTRPIDELPKPLAEVNDEIAVICETTSLWPIAKAASTEAGRENLNTVLFELCEHTVVATDGHRLHKMYVKELKTRGKHIDFPVALPFIGLVESAASAYKAKHRIFSFDKEKKAVICRVGEMTLRTRVADVMFPDWRQVVPKKSKFNVEVPRAKLLDALAGAQLVTKPRDGVRGVKLERVEQGLRVFCQDSDKHVFDETIPCDGWEISESTGLNVQYLVDALMPTQSDVVLLGVSDDVSPVAIDDPAGLPGYLAVVMPMRL